MSSFKRYKRDIFDSEICDFAILGLAMIILITGIVVNSETKNDREPCYKAAQDMYEQCVFNNDKNCIEKYNILTDRCRK